MKPRSVHAVNENQKDDMLALVWDLNWSSVKDSDALNRYWLNDLAREALLVYYSRASARKMKIHGHEYGLPDAVSACQLYAQPACAE